METTFRTVDELIKSGEQSPLPLEVIQTIWELT